MLYVCKVVVMGGWVYSSVIMITLPIIVTQCKLNTEEKTKQHLLYLRRRLPSIEA